MDKYGYVLCDPVFFGDATEQKKCAAYQPSGEPHRPWCKYNYDVRGGISDECRCPGILEMIKK